MMQTTKPRARYLHRGQVVVYRGSYKTARWLYYDVTLDAALKRLHQHELHKQIQPVV